MVPLARWLLLAVLAIPSIAAAQSEIPAASRLQVDQSEALRRGDMVTIAGEGARSGDEQEYLMAIAPPRDDSDQWFITVWWQANCAPCERLKRDFRNDPELLAFVAPTPGGPSGEASRPAWAHYMEFNGNDRTQDWRRRAASPNITAYPTIIVQPPRDGRYGKPSNTVFRMEGYFGAKDLSDRIRRAVAEYVRRNPRYDARLGGQPLDRPFVTTLAVHQVDEGGARQAPPPRFDTPPPVEYPDFQPQQIIPPENKAFQFDGLSWALSAGKFMLFLVIVGFILIVMLAFAMLAFLVLRFVFRHAAAAWMAMVRASTPQPPAPPVQASALSPTQPTTAEIVEEVLKQQKTGRSSAK